MSSNDEDNESVSLSPSESDGEELSGEKDSEYEYEEYETSADEISADLEMKPLPAYACCYCNNTDTESVAKCLVCNKWFCNAENACGSHIVKHCVISGHKSIKLHKDGVLHKGIEFSVCCINDPTHNNIFELGTCCSSTGYTALICRSQCLNSSSLRDVNWNADTWKHIIQNKYIVPMLLSPHPAHGRNIINISNDDINNLEQKWKTNPEATIRDINTYEEDASRSIERIPLVFETAKMYEDVFIPLIEKEEASSKTDNDSKCLEDVSVIWEHPTSQCTVAVFHIASTDSRYRVNVGQSLTLHYATAIGKRQEDVECSGKVISVRGEEVRMAVSSHNALVGRTSGFRLTFDWNGISFSRMKNALAHLYDNDCMSEFIYRRLMGRNVVGDRYVLPTLKTLSISGFPELNSSQSRAVSAALQNQLTLIQGPPGTGKTVVSATIVYHIVHLFQEQVLVVAPSNIAADNLTMRIHSLGINIVRVVAKSRESVSSIVEKNCLHYLVNYIGKSNSELSRLNAILEETGQLSKQEKSMYEKLKKIAETLILQNAEVICCTCSTSLSETLNGMTFKSVLIDESTQACEPECIIPLVHGCERLIMVGDHKQLGPVILNREAKVAGFNISLFERLLMLDEIPYRLNVQYRMHPALSEFSSNIFYEGELQNGIHASERTRNIDFPWPRSDKPMMFWCVDGNEDPGSSGKSLQNRLEAKAVENVVARLLSCGITPDRIGVITPYDSQRGLLLTLMSKQGSLSGEKYAGIEIASVDEFQGREKDYIIFSCVRANNNGEIGFLRDYRRMNVAITRAKYGIVIVGHAPTLKTDSLWRSLLLFYQEKKCLVSGANLNNLSTYMIHNTEEQTYYSGRQFQLANRNTNSVEKYSRPESSAFLGMPGIANMATLKKGNDVFVSHKLDTANNDILKIVNAGEFEDTGL